MFRKKLSLLDKILLFMIIIGILSCIPILILGIYNFPSADDYSYTTLTYHSWKENKSFLDLLRSAIETDTNYYNNWQGLYSSAFLLSLQPAIFGDEFYALTPFFMLLIIYGSICYLSYIVLYKKLHARKIEAFFVGVVVSFITVQWMPSAVEGLYWFNGAANYVFFWGILLLLIARLLIMYNKKSIYNLIIVIVLGVILEGGNHVSAFMGLLTLIGVVIFGIVKKDRIYAIYNSVILLFMGVGFYFNISSPGTANRQACFTKLGVMETMIQSIQNVFYYLDSWLNVRTIFILICILPVCYKIMKRFISSTSFEFRYPFFIIILSFGWLCAMLCPPLYAMGNVGSGRLTNLVYFGFVVLVVINEFYYMGWLMKKVRLAEKPKLNLEKTLIGLALCFLIISYWERGNFISYQATTEIYTGEAKQYYNEMTQRSEIIKNASEMEDVIVPALSVHPCLLFFDDITTDETDWRNINVAQYYDLKSIKVQ